jgi:hypothetical protein
MRFEVIENFIDSQDKRKKYKVGDSFPQPANKKISEERLTSLLSADNKLRRPVIREIAKTEKQQDVD